MSDWYQATGAPGQGSSGSSAVMRGEFTAIEAAFNKLPTLTGKADYVAVVNPGGGALTTAQFLTVAQGGTGQASLTSGGIMLGNGTDPVNVTAAPADGEIILGDGVGAPQLVQAFSAVDGYLEIGFGGTGAKTATGARTALGLGIGTDVQAYDADTSKTDVAETRSATINMADNEFIRPLLKDYAEKLNALGSVSGTTDIDLEDGNVVTAQITGNTTFTFSNPPASNGGGFTLVLTNGGSSTVTWPSSVDWDGSFGAPTLTSSGRDVLTFVNPDGGAIWYGVLVSQDAQ